MSLRSLWARKTQLRLTLGLKTGKRSHWIILRYKRIDTVTDDKEEFLVVTDEKEEFIGIANGLHLKPKGIPACQLMNKYKSSGYAVEITEYVKGQDLSCMSCLKLMFAHRD